MSGVGPIFLGLAIIAIMTLVFGVFIRVIVIGLILGIAFFVCVGMLAGCNDVDRGIDANEAFLAWKKKCTTPVIWQTEHDANDMTRQGFLAMCRTAESQK